MRPDADVVLSGVGVDGPHRHQERLGVEMAAEALTRALADSGLDRRALDGLVVNMGGTAGPDYDQLARFAGLQIQTAYQTWAHGRFTASTIQLARMMISGGLATHVACIYGYHLDNDAIGGAGWKGWAEENRWGGGPHGEEPAVGLTAPVGNAALAARIYCERYGIDPIRLYSVCEGLRANAAGNPSAIFREPLLYSDYESAPALVDPLCRFDCAPVSEGGACIVVSRASEVETAGRPAVRILGFQGVPAGPDEFIWSRRGLGIFEQDADEPFREPPIFARSGVDRSDVDVFYTYDAFSPLVWFGLERFGYCEYGTAPDYVDKFGLGLDSELPVNSHGGMLSEGHLSGWGHLVEAVRQLRGDAGSRQVRGARVAHWGAAFGESLILGA
jgi:acetyl-CoA acetyltransferase